MVIKPEPTNNIGGAWDGLLNGAYQTGGQADEPLDPNTLFVPGAFITEEDLQDLDGIDQAATADGVGGDGNYVDDPGWVNLGKSEGVGNVALETLDGITISDYMNFTFECTEADANDCRVGIWELNFTDAAGLLSALDDSVFGDSFFDHLALGFKNGNEFAFWDFDFNIISDATGNLFDLSQPHNFTGAFDFSDNDFFTAGISHISVWARDPADVNDVPAPMPLALLGISLLALSASRRKA